MNKHLIIAFLLLAAFSSQNAKAQLVINEGSNKNYSTISDEDGDFSDWIEIYNGTTSTIDLFNYSLSDDIGTPNKWVFPHYNLPINSFLVVFCSGKDRYITPAFTLVHNSGAFSPTVGWNTHTFTTPFAWDGVSNIAINICSFSSLGYITNSVFNQTATSYQSTVFAYQDGSPASCYTTMGQTANQRANMKFNGISIDNGTIQNCNTCYPAPYGNWYWGARHQSIYRASELAAAGLTAGNITSLAFDVASTDPVNYDYIEIHMKQVTDSAVTNTFLNTGGSFFHTNFSLSGSGQKVYIFNPSAVLADSLRIDCTMPDISTGALPNASGTYNLFAAPTPGASNNGSTSYTAFAATPIISVASGFFTTGFSDIIANPNGTGSQVYYTLDGSTPTLASTLYTGVPIPIAISKVIRAIAFAPGKLPSAIKVCTYLFNVNHVTPIISVVTDDANLYGPTGIFDNFTSDWLRKAYVEYFDSTSAHNLIFSQNSGIIMDGGLGGSRSNPQHSFRLELSNGVVGENTQNYPFIPGRPNRTAYSNFYLRNGSNQWMNFPYKDAVAVKMMSGTTNNYYSAMRPVTVYINGQYFGLYELREKFDTEMFKTFENATKSTTEILSLSAFYNYVLRALTGSVDHYYSAHDSLMALNTADTAYWTKADHFVDMTYYTDYVIAETWIGNTDWPGNNIKIYKSDATNDRWRFCTIDFELALNPSGWTVCSSDNINYVLGYDNTNPFINIWQKSLGNERFRDHFINRYADVMNTEYDTTRLLPIERNFYQQWTPEMPKEFARWDSPGNVVTDMVNYYNNHLTYESELACRNTEVRNQLQSHFSLPRQVDVTLDAYPLGAGTVHISTISPGPYPWKGIYFDGLPVKIEAIANPGYAFSHWENNALLSDTLNGVFNDTLNIDSVTFKAYFVKLPDAPTTNFMDDIGVYPSPALNTLIVVSKYQPLDHYQIFDVNGKIVREGSLSNAQIENVVELVGLAPGMYFIRLKNDGVLVKMLKFVKL